MPDDPTPPTAPLPFAACDERTRRAIGAAIESVDNLIYQLIRRTFPLICHADRDDIAQVVRVHLAVYSLPKFDPARGVKLSTYLHTCISNRVRSFLPGKSTTGRRRKLPPPEDIDLLDIEAPDQTHDRAIERLAAAILKNPRRYGLTPVQIEILQALRAAEPDTRLFEIAERLGYAAPSSFSKPFAGLRAKLMAIDIDAAAEKSEPKSEICPRGAISPLTIPDAASRRRGRKAVIEADGNNAGDAGGSDESKRAGVPAHGGVRAASHSRRSAPFTS